MKRILPAFAAAFLIHVLLLTAAPDWLVHRTITAPQAHVVTMQLIDRPVYCPSSIQSVEPPPPLPDFTPVPAVMPPPNKKPRVSTKRLLPAQKAVVRQPLVHQNEAPRPNQAPPVPPAAPAAPEPPAESSSSAATPKKTAIQDVAPLLQAVSARTPAGADAIAEKASPAVASVIMAKPRYNDNPPPVYPAIARKRGYEGSVLLEVFVDEAGRVGDLRVAQSSGHRLLDRSAIKAVEGWQFEPGRHGDQRVAMWVRIPVAFRLQ